MNKTPVKEATGTMAIPGLATKMMMNMKRPAVTAERRYRAPFITLMVD